MALDWRSEKLANVAVCLALLAGAASFFCSFCVLGLAALNAGFIKIVLFNPTSDPYPWVVPTIVGISFVVAVGVVSLILRNTTTTGQFHSGKL